jgi:hypothetical protein
MARTKAIFDWVFGLTPLTIPYILAFSLVENEEIRLEPLQMRREKEAAGLQRLLPLTEQIRTLPHLHRFLFTEHDVYAVDRLDQPCPTMPDTMREMY